MNKKENEENNSEKYESLSVLKSHLLKLVEKHETVTTALKRLSAMSKTNNPSK